MNPSSKSSRGIEVATVDHAWAEVRIREPSGQRDDGPPPARAARPRQPPAGRRPAAVVDNETI
jgi:hypothetical protein